MLKNSTFVRLFIFVLCLSGALNVSAGTFYWVGNSGNWSNSHNWALTSGGKGGAGIPSLNDDVVFDINSFDSPNQQIGITGTAACHSMLWASGVDYPILNGNSFSSLDIYGSLNISPEVDFQFKGGIHFKSSQTGNSINTYGKGFFNKVYFEGNGSWQLNSPLIISSSLTMSSGDIDANGHEIACTDLNIEGYSRKDLDMGSALLYIDKQVNQINSGSFQVISTGKIFYNHYVISNLSASTISHTTHRATSVDSSHYVVILPTCNQSDSGLSCNGKVIISKIFPAGGGPYSYSWNGGLLISADSLTGICVGQTIQYQIYDSSDGSLSSPVIIFINSPTPLSITYSKRQPRCNGYCDGWLRYYISGETPSYTYFWYGGGPSGVSAGGSGNYLYDSSLCAGKYKIHIKDSRGCHNTLTPITLTDPPAVEVTATVTQPLCNVSCNGTATANPSGGHSGTSYTYKWLPGGQTTQTITNLCPGNYTVIAFDDSSCSDSFVVTIVPPPPVTVSTSQTNVSCNGACDGTATATGGGGTSPYTYKWTPGGLTTPTITSLCAGVYKVVVTDKNGCKDSANVTITQPPKLTVSITAVPNPLKCNGDCNAGLSANVAGGTAPYSYKWKPGGQTTQTISNQCIGSYTVIVTDAHGCKDSANVTITQPTALSILISAIIPPTCNGACNGSITATVSGGTPAYSYKWKPGGQITPTISGLCGGTYTLTVTDKNGCVDSSIVTLIQPPPLSISLNIADITCNGFCDGQVLATVSGGTAPYTYNWMPGITVAQGQGTDTIHSLCPGNDSLRVTDKNGCTQVIYFSITQPTPLSAVITSTTSSCLFCNGSGTVKGSGGTPPYVYSWSPGGQTSDSAINLCIGTYTVTIKDADSCSVIKKVTIVPTVNIIITTSATTVSCFGSCDGTATANPAGGSSPYTYLWMPSGQTNQTATNLCGGVTYTVTVNDVNGCVNTDSVTFINPPKLQDSTQHTNVSCNGSCDGTGTAYAYGGTGAYTYSWSNGQTTSVANGLCKGVYTFTVTDANNCTTVDSVTITQANPIAANPIVTDATCKNVDGSITTTPTGGVGGYTYSWAPGGQTTQNIGPIAAGVYTVTITDSAGCSKMFIIAVNNTTGPTLSSKITNTACSNTCTGFDSIIVVAGTGPFTYSWNTGGTTDSLNNLCAGTYICTVTDALGCITNETTVINSPPAINPNPTVKDITCNGLKNGSISFAPSGGTPGYTYVWAPPVSVGSSAINLTQGTYTITVGDSKGCDTVVDITITQPAVLTVTMTSTNITCNGFCDGTATANVSGGTSPYIYSWTPGGGVVPKVVNLCAGNDTVNVTDINGCNATATVTITQPTPLTETTAFVNVSCNLGSNGSASITVSGGTSGYTYNWSNGATTDTITNLTPGTYYITATDANGCQINDSVKITQPIPIVIKLDSTDVTCNGSCNGTATATSVTGGTSPYAYLWSNGLTTTTISNLCPGNYTLTVTDANSCTSSNNITITEPSKLQANASSTNTSCPSAASCDGTASSSPVGGTSPYTYKWSNGLTTSTIINLCAGNYTVYVTDANSCTDSATVTITRPTPITIATAIAPSGCGVCNGVINVTPSGGTPAYTYLWSSGQITSTVSGLCAGVYTVTVGDANGCDSSFTIILGTSGGPSTATVVIANDSCNSLCDGYIGITPIGGTSPYTYSWTPSAQTNDTATNLCIGSYTVKVTDAAGCQFFDTASISQPPVLTNTGVSTNAACLGKCTGTITLTTSGGTPPYKYSWSSGATASNLINLCPGIYTVTISDANNCSLIQTDTVGQNTSVTDPTTITKPLLCNGACTGKATTTPSGGTSPYTYNWSNGEISQADTLLCVGTYTVTVTDKNGCQGIDSAVIVQPSAITIALKGTSVTCNNSCDGKIVGTVSGGTPAYTYNWSNGNTTDSITNVCSGKDTLNVTDANGCTVWDTLTLINPPAMSESHIVTTASCNTTNDGSITIVTVVGGIAPYKFSWSPGGMTTQNISNLLPGTYVLTLKDSTNCEIIDSIKVGSTITVLAEAGNDTTVCANTSILLDGTKSTNATSYQWFQLPGLSSLGTTPTIVVNPPTGATTKYLLVTYDGPCNDSDTVAVTVNPLPIVSAGPTQTVFLGTSATIGGSPTGPAGSTYSWSPSAGLNDTAIANPVATPTVTTTYTVTVTTAAGCVATDTVEVVVLPQLIIPSGFTPNGDGTNDVWNLRNITEFPGVVVEVFNRWGEELFRSAGYKTPWDGRYNGQDLPVGTYYYVVNLNDPRFPKAYTGPVTIMR